MGNETIDTSNNISPYLRQPQQDSGIKNYFLEAQKRAAQLGQDVKKRMPPIFDNYLNNNSYTAQWHPNASSQSTASGIDP